MSFQKSKWLTLNHILK